MKIKLLRRLRKKHRIYYSYERGSLKDNETGLEIEGRFFVRNPFTHVNTYSSSIEYARTNRREIILEDVQRRRYRENRNKRIVE